MKGVLGEAVCAAVKGGRKEKEKKKGEGGRKGRGGGTGLE